MLSYLTSFDCLSIYQLYKQPVLVILMTYLKKLAYSLFRVKNVNEMKNLKIHDLGLEKSFKVARLNQKDTDSNVSVDIKTVATNHINKFPTADSAFTDDFSLLPKFAPTDTLEHLKNCRKNTS